MIHAIDVAISQIGVVEETGQNDGEPADLYMAGDELPWCAGFVLWCFARSQDPQPPGGYWPNRSVATFEASCKAAGLWMGWAIVPARNDVIFFGSRMLSDLGPGRHVGIVEAVRGHEIHTVEGNTANRVARRVYQLGAPQIAGYARITAPVA